MLRLLFFVGLTLFGCKKKISSSPQNTKIPKAPASVRVVVVDLGNETLRHEGLEIQADYPESANSIQVVLCSDEKQDSCGRDVSNGDRIYGPKFLIPNPLGVVREKELKLVVATRTCFLDSALEKIQGDAEGYYCRQDWVQTAISLKPTQDMEFAKKLEDLFRAEASIRSTAEELRQQAGELLSVLIRSREEAVDGKTRRALDRLIAPIHAEADGVPSDLYDMDGESVDNGTLVGEVSKDLSLAPGSLGRDISAAFSRYEQLRKQLKEQQERWKKKP